MVLKLRFFFGQVTLSVRDLASGTALPPLNWVQPLAVRHHMPLSAQFPVRSFDRTHFEYKFCT